jgi:hypothetical protein
VLCRPLMVALSALARRLEKRGRPYAPVLAALEKLAAVEPDTSDRGDREREEDLDVNDPSLLPGVGTPEPGGLTFQELISLLKKLQLLHVIGFDIVELTPDYDPTQVSSVTASVILREMILAFCPKP